MANASNEEGDTSIPMANASNEEGDTSKLLTKLNITENGVAAMSIGSITAPGIVVYILFVIVALCNKRFNQNPYFLLAGTLGIAENFTLVFMLFYSVPCTIHGRNIGGPIVHRVIGSLVAMGWYMSMPLMLALGFNRYLCVCKKHLYERVFTLRNTKLVNALAWAVGFFYFFMTLIEDCAYIYIPNSYSWSWNLPHTCATVISFTEVGIALTICVITGITNGFVFSDFRKMHNKMNEVGSKQELNRRKRELKLFFQFFITATVLAVFDMIFNLTLFVPVSKWGYLGVTLLYTVNCSINGWVYLFLNASVRREMMALLGCGGARNNTVTVMANSTAASGLIDSKRKISPSAKF